MKYKEFRRWCNDRACDGCWGLVVAAICLGVMKEIDKLPFWKRERAWRKLDAECLIVEEIVNPINLLIEGRKHGRL